ncbi:MAG: DUF3500 domain-containing protein [Amphritea sp.]|nr:DUF3500 domain-containing protein [Amphritea sp.]
MKKQLAIAALSTILSTQAIAHVIEIDKNTELVPIPAYNLPYGPANGENALRAAQAFLASFDDETKEHFVFDLKDSVRREWSNLPAGIVDRSGLSVGEMNPEQRARLFEFLSSSLSQEGYQHVMNIMAAEAFLSQDRRAERLKWAPENYWISFYGSPSADAPWGWQYGGHHLGLNMAVENNRVESMSPSFIGTEPAVFTYKGVDYESVVNMHRASYAVFAALTPEQQKKADATRGGKDVATGPGEDGYIPEQIGLAASEMNDAQRDLLITAIEQWVLVQPKENADIRMQEIISEMDQLTFAWHGTDEVNSRCYLRIQSPSLIIELHSSGRNVGKTAASMGHYHTIYRNPQNEYGGVEPDKSFW